MGEATHIYHASFHFWWKGNLVKYQNFSKYYVHHCSLNNLKTKVDDADAGKSYKLKKIKWLSE